VKYRFLFILLVVLLFQFVAIDPQLYNGICVSLILLIGVPHGAADHRINSTLSGDKDTRGFILHYVLIAVGYAVWWLMMPAQAALVFYVMSMYHFGQEFLEELEIPKPSAVEIMIWGGGILLLPSLIAHHEIVASFQWLTEGSEVIHFHPYIRLSVMGLLPLLLLGSVYSLVDSGRMDRQKAIKAVVFISALNLSYLFLPFLVAFTLYFILFHSLNAFQHQYGWLRRRISNYRLKSFLKDLSLFSFLSIGGLMLLIYLLKEKEWSELIIYFFMIISIVTLPHSILFDQFYKSRKAKD
jgi:Brp/Blh family beta-carotene 15,15'-monooxygenase